MNTFLKQKITVFNAINILASLAMLASLCLIQLNGITTALGYQHVVVALIVTAALTTFRFWLQRRAVKRQPVKVQLSILFYTLMLTLFTLFIYFTCEHDNSRTTHALAYALLLSALTIPTRPQPTLDDLTTKSSDK
ncbi:hypothetical protein [Moritella viscosa]|uniref:hypothetical protein n=1 Tax=Moritella viscosa TaxID=80854 RepID=UPI00091B3950|nr:hypothetical protein [Moritella viscosa]SGZ09505.1 unnamed protein product [Moritella viscosa]